MNNLLLQTGDISGTVIGGIISCIAALAGAIGFLHRQTMTRIDADQKEIKGRMISLETKLESESIARQASDLKALKAEIMAEMPCRLENCPKLRTYSLGKGICASLVPDII